MGLDGGGGGGGGILGVTGSFTGPAEALEIVGEHCYAYSGPVTDAASGAADTTVLNFTSGNYYAVVEVSFVTDHGTGNDAYLDILFNNSTVYKGTFDASQVHTVVEQPFNLLIPAYTEVLVKWGIDGVTNALSFIMVGRVYR